jgi:hypothetical protein
MMSMPRFGISLAGALMALSALQPTRVDAQDWTRREYPEAPPNSRGNFVAPYFDGYYKNADGTYTLSFGFMNRNESELIEIPLGEDNFIEPAAYDGIQPTSFPVVSYSGFGGPRERGAFGVVVPADFQGEVWWTVTTDGYTTKVPGKIRGRPGQLLSFESAYELSTTPQAEGSLRPTIRFSENGEDVWGLHGLWNPQVYTTRVGQPVEVTFWAHDRGERELGQVNMSLWKHQGPVGSKVTFESLVEAVAGAGASRGFNLPDGVTLDDLPPEIRARVGRGGRGRQPGPGPVGETAQIRIPDQGPNADKGIFRATFDTPGEYVVRIRIDSFNASGDSQMGNQCCWSNGYVRVNVTE